MRNLLSWLFAWVLTAGSAGAAEPALSDQQWRADIEQMVAAVKEIHFKPFHNVSEAEFDARVTQLLGRLDESSDRETLIEMAEIVALLGDGHTRVHLPRLYPEFALEAELGHGGTPPPTFESLKFAQLPLRFGLFDNGLYVVGARPEHADLIGNRVVRFDETTAAAAISAVRAVSFTENDSRAKLMAPDRLALPDVLAYLGVTQSANTTFLTTATSNGEEETVELRSITTPGLPFVSGLPDVLPSWQKHRDEFRWYEVREADDAIYVQVNQFEENPIRPYGEFVAETLQAARDAGVSRYIVDLRRNSGGIGAWVTPFVTGLSRSEFNEYGRLFILIGRTTFSAAQHFLHKFEEISYAAFVGEPSGAKPSHYGDGKRVVLENSGVTVRVSTIYWHSWLANDFRDSINPHLPVEYNVADYLSGGDPVLEAAIAYEAPESLAAQMDEQFRLGANQNALLLFTRFMSDGSRSDHETVVPDLRVMADELAADGYVRPGFFVYFLLDRTFPSDPATRAGLERLEALQE